MGQKITSAATLWLLLSAASVHAADMPEQYTLYCKGEKAAGFDWTSNDWEKSSFKPSDYIVVKSPNNKCFDVDGKMKEVAGVLRWKEVCVNIREVGKEYQQYMSGKCTEYYPDPSRENENPSLGCKNIFQENFATSFNGWFHRAIVHGDVENRKYYKDSLAIEVGKCSQIN